MPEYKEDQTKFRIHFSDPSDTIDKNGHYVSRWTDLTKDYQIRVSEYPQLLSKVSNLSAIETLPRDDRILAQEYIDSINTVLDTELSGFKSLLFPDIWKLGFAFLSADSDGIKYQIFRIPKGDPSPLLIKEEDTPLFEPIFGPHTLTERSVPRDFFGNPHKAGRDFVFEKAEVLVNQRALPVFGIDISEDVILGFIDEYHRFLSLPPHCDQYSLAAVRTAMDEHLIDLCSRFIWTHLRSPHVESPLDLDSMRIFFGNIDPKTLEPSPQPIMFSLTSKYVPIKAAFSALDYLVSQEVNQVHRSFALPDYESNQRGNLIWSAYSFEDEIKSVSYILGKSVEQYSEFIKGNGLGLKQSPYLDDETSIVFVYESSYSRDISRGPLLKEYHLDDARDRLPKVTVLFNGDGSSHEDLNGSDFPEITYRGEKYKAKRASHSAAMFFFQRTPFLRMIYRMLIDDLQATYGNEYFRGIVI